MFLIIREYWKSANGCVLHAPQGVVTYTSPVEAFATGIKNLDRRKSSLIAWSLRSEALERLILREFKGQNVATPAKYLRKCVDRLILVAQNLSWSLDRLLKRTLIAWFHFDPGRKRFYRRGVCDYPLREGARVGREEVDMNRIRILSYSCYILKLTFPSSFNNSVGRFKLTMCPRSLLHWIVTSFITADEGTHNFLR